MRSDVEYHGVGRGCAGGSVAPAQLNFSLHLFTVHVLQVRRLIHRPYRTMADTLTKLAYQTFQQGKGAFGLAHKSLTNQLMSVLAPSVRSATTPLSDDLLSLVRQRRDQLLETDWNEAEAGIYPASLLFENPWDDFFLYYPLIWLDLPQIWERMGKKQYQAFSPAIKTDSYPSYYVQNFHYQTDGYLSDLSANLYDLQVEILFNGSADAMRRRILAPLQRGLSELTVSHAPRILDVACGTGRSLRFLRGTFPDAALFGVDLSPAYLRKANQLLSKLPGELPQLVQANAEELPYADGYFQAISSVFLFHELPPEARQQVMEECFRVLQPGGTLVICDSIQLSDSPELAPMIENFPSLLHEPYYRHYASDNLVERLETAGFISVETESHFVSKYWIARKPA